MTTTNPKTTRIGVFYDGNYFFHVSNYYTYYHERQARISLHGFHEFLKGQIAKLEGNDPKLCHIVEAHYFRGKISAREAEAKQRLLGERLFEDVLMREGVVTHYLPMGPDGEKGIDVWFALETIELATSKRFDVAVLVAGDGDYTCLVRKINAIGTRVMVSGWDLEFTDDRGEKRHTTTSSMLLSEAAYPLMVSSIVDDKSHKDDPQVNNMFVRDRYEPDENQIKHKEQVRTDLRAEQDRQPNSDKQQEPAASVQGDSMQDIVKVGKIHNLQPGYGFLMTDDPGRNLFFVKSDYLGDYSALQRGDIVEYVEGTNARGDCARQVILQQ